MNENHAARLVAAYFILGLKGIARDRIAIDAYGRLYLDREPLWDNTRNRIGILTCIILDCVGGDTTPGISNTLGDHPAYRANTRWVAERLRDGEMIEIVGEFLALRETA